MTKIHVSRKTRVARDVMYDIDYTDKLNDTESAWLQTFVRATATGSIDDMAKLVNYDKDKLAKLQKKIYAEDHSARRDIMHAGQRVSVSDYEMDSTVHSELGSLSSTQFESVRCGRCCRVARRCQCPGRVRAAPYGQSDYLVPESSEDSIQAAIDLKRRMEAFDLLPYGDAPKGLKQGHAVKICLPHHLLNKAWGYVLDYCPLRNKYLIRSMNREGLKGRDGITPKATVAWITADGLRRCMPRPVT